MFINNSQDKPNKSFNFKWGIVIGFTLILIFIGILFINKNIITKEYFLVLKGDTDLIIKQNSIYEEAGFKAYDNRLLFTN